MAIDFTHLEIPQHCFNTGGDMLHVADNPHAKVPLAFTCTLQSPSWKRG
jgi:hypothetical protein